jgi:subtilisin-like proprotein convertase family protein
MRRRFRLVAVLPAVVFTALALLLAACPLAGQGMITYFSAPGSAPIPDGDTVYSGIMVPKGFRVSDVNVTLNVTHPNLGQLDAALHSPSGTPMPLFFLISGANLVNTTFDDEAAAPIDTGTAPFTGSWQIDSNLVGASLSAFDGENASGVWTLTVTDQAVGETGTLDSWSITFNTP